MRKINKNYFIIIIAIFLNSCFFSIDYTESVDFSNAENEAEREISHRGASFIPLSFSVPKSLTISSEGLQFFAEFTHNKYTNLTWSPLLPIPILPTKSFSKNFHYVFFEESSICQNESHSYLILSVAPPDSDSIYEVNPMEFFLVDKDQRIIYPKYYEVRSAAYNQNNGALIFTSSRSTESKKYNINHIKDLVDEKKHWQNLQIKQNPKFKRIYVYDSKLAYIYIDYDFPCKKLNNSKFVANGFYKDKKRITIQDSKLDNKGGLVFAMFSAD